MNNEHYSEMFQVVLSGEGKMLKGYSFFHQYSFYNQMYAMWQIIGKGIEISPIATFKKWQELGRQVKRGEKAIELCVPNKWKNKETDEEGMYFSFKKGWFALSQTEGTAEISFPEVSFDFDKCLENLNITKEPFRYMNGNAQGYAKKGGIIAINPLAELADKTFFHEIAHCLLHLENDIEFIDNAETRRDIRELEAESVALCVSIALGLEKNIEYCVGYIKHYLRDNEIPVESIKKIFRATDKILKAGKVE